MFYECSGGLEYNMHAGILPDRFTGDERVSL